MRTASFLFGLALLACAHTVPVKDSLLETVRTRAAYDNPDCSAANISVAPRYDRSTDSAEVDACGKHVIYTCPIDRHRFVGGGSLQRRDIRDACIHEPL
jgi:hypothetical protein